MLSADLTVNDPVTWSANTTLTLAAANDIYINNAIAINGAAGPGDELRRLQRHHRDHAGRRHELLHPDPCFL